MPRSDALSDVRVLIVDDSEDMREMVALALEIEGARTWRTGSCAEALALFPRARPDVVVADIGLPDEDGYALIRRIRALAPAEGGRVPAIALTGFPGAEHRAVSAGYQRCLSKPVLPEVIVSTVAEVGRPFHTGGP